MKKLIAVLLSCSFATLAYADIIVPPSVWEQIKERPQTNIPTIFIPEPTSEDEIPAMEHTVSDDLTSGDAVAETPEPQV